MLFMAILCLMTTATTAQTTAPALTAKQEKMCNNNAKKRAKQFTKEGYKIMGSQLLETALYKHYAKTELGAIEQQGSGHSKSKNLGRQMCLNSAMAEYASKESSMMKGRTVYDSKGNEINTDDKEEFANFYAAFERLTQASIKGDLQESFTLCKENPDGTYDFSMYMTIDPSKARKNREKAIADALSESKISQEFARQLSEFVNEGFPQTAKGN